MERTAVLEDKELLTICSMKINANTFIVVSWDLFEKLKTFQYLKDIFNWSIC